MTSIDKLVRTAILTIGGFVFANGLLEVMITNKYINGGIPPRKIEAISKKLRPYTHKFLYLVREFVYEYHGLDYRPEHRIPKKGGLRYMPNVKF